MMAFAMRIVLYEMLSQFLTTHQAHSLSTYLLVLTRSRR